MQKRKKKIHGIVKNDFIFKHVEQGLSNSVVFYSCYMQVS